MPFWTSQTWMEIEKKIGALSRTKMRFDMFVVSLLELAYVRTYAPQRFAPPISRIEKVERE